MSIEFTTPTSSDPLHVADAIVRHGRKVTTASLWMVGGQLVAEAPAEQRLDPDRGRRRSRQRALPRAPQEPVRSHQLDHARDRSVRPARPRRGRRSASDPVAGRCRM